MNKINRLTMGQLSKGLYLLIMNTQDHTVPLTVDQA